MRKAIIIGSLLSLSLTSWAQERKFQLGILGSSNLSYVNTNQGAADAGSRLLFGFGGLMEYRFAERYAFTSGFEYMNRGGTLAIADTTNSYRAGFIQIPVMIKMRTREFGYNTYFAEMGFSIGIETGETIEREPSGGNIENHVGLFDATFRIGGGMEYDLGGETKVFGRLMYHRALLNNLLGDENPSLSEDFVYRFDYVSLSVGILF